MVAADPLSTFHPAVAEWFRSSFDAPTDAQKKAWPHLAKGQNTLLLAPTGSGKTLAAFLVAIDKLMFEPTPEPHRRCRVLYISPLKALAVDVERNLRSPLTGTAIVADRRGDARCEVVVGIRSGDTSASERAKLSRRPPDILITTPESLYLMLSSQARESLRYVETVIIDEIHSVAATKRGAHLFLSLERLEALRAGKKPLQRIGLSATQRPLDEIARLLGGGELTGEGDAARWMPRPVEIVDTGTRKSIEVRIEVPIEDMARIGEPAPLASGDASRAAPKKSIWPSLYPRLVEHIRANRSTMIFVNSRRLAERLAESLNDEAGEELALAHHGSLARERRQEIEERLKQGKLPAIVATSSLELGLDLGAVDLVLQVEAPPSVASGLQRIGRARHQVGGTPRGVIFPKFRGDLLASASVAERMRKGAIEATFYPRRPLDVLAQHIVAVVASAPIHIDELYALVCGAANFAELSRGSFEGVLDMLSGRYPSDEFAELRARITWDRLSGQITPRQGALRIAVVNAGTIPDRGMYGVFLESGDERTSRRVGELDEEMVFESRIGEVFRLGASSWRIENITHDRVLVSPAPGAPGKMPFWHGDRPGRPAELGRAIGELTRALATNSGDESTATLMADHGLDEHAARNLLAYVDEQKLATTEVPSDQTIVVERFLDELGDWRVCVLSPFGARVHAPWAMCVTARLREELGVEVDVMWSDDGMVFRLPESTEAPPPDLFLLDPASVESELVRHLGSTSLFAAHFRECAARALLLPRRYPGKRSPLWAQRKKSADLLSVASRYGSFPILLETYRECMKDVFDLPALVELLGLVQRRTIRVVTVDTRVASPFASSLLFSWVGNFIYDEDAPLAERRAQALSIDTAQLRELLGDVELRELFDADAISVLNEELQRRTAERAARNEDGVHDLLLAIGDLTREEIAERVRPVEAAAGWIDSLQTAGRVIEVGIANEKRFVAAEDAGRYRDALGVVLPRGLPLAFLEPVRDPWIDLVSRFARTHGPFTVSVLAERYGVARGAVITAVGALVERGRLVEGEFLPGGHEREVCDVEVLRSLKRKSLARLRSEVEPVTHEAYARLLTDWQGVARPRRGLDSLLSVIEQLQGVPLSASVLESEILPARISDFAPEQLDALLAAGELVWSGLEQVGPRDGKIGIYLTDQAPFLLPTPVPLETEIARRIRDFLRTRGAAFFQEMHAELGGLAADLAHALWDLIWNGEVTNDTLTPLRRWMGANGKKLRDREHPRSLFRSRRVGPPGTEGRFSLARPSEESRTRRSLARARLMLERYGITVREAANAENVQGGFSGIYGVLKTLEEQGRVRRGYFVAGLGALQFALPGAAERLRDLREPKLEGKPIVLSAVDPASPWGALLRWPERRDDARPSRVAGAHTVSHEGRLLAYLSRGEQAMLTFLRDDEVGRAADIALIAEALREHLDDSSKRALLVATVDGLPASDSPLAGALSLAGFSPTTRGFHLRRPVDNARR